MILVDVLGITFYPPSKGYAVLLKENGGNRYIPIVIGKPEAQSIAMVLEGIELPRPLTHDLFINTLNKLDAIVSKVSINRLHENTYYAELRVISKNSGVFNIDSRPSDAIAIALRFDVQIFVSESVMEVAGLDNLILTDQESQILSEFQKKPDTTETIKILDNAMQQAIEGEEYEAAAKIRDRLNFLKKKSKKVKTVH